jgi:ABC-type uncharacterized transport system substrate-binding protein
MTCRTLGLLVTLALSIFVALVAASAQPRATPARIAFLGLSPEPPASARPPVVAAFQQHLRELGWMEGQNLTIEWRWAEGSLERFTTLVEEVVRLPVEVLVVPNATTAWRAQWVTTMMPIVAMGGGSLAQDVGSLARPDGNVTGMASFGPELATKRLELLTHAIPGLTCVAVLRGLAGLRLELQAMEVGARALGVQRQLLEVPDPTAIDQAVSAASREGAGALVVFANGDFFRPHGARIAELALTHRLPTIFGERAYVAAGGLMSYGSSPAERGHRVAA